MIKYASIYLAIVVILFGSCEDKPIEVSHAPPGFMETPLGFEPFEVPEDNAFSQIRWELGKKLFYDPIMSLDSTISCASCHKQSIAFSDDAAQSIGVKNRLGTRNAPSLANLAYHPYYTREGSVPTLEMQILVPIQEHDEFDFNIVLLAERLQQDSHYVDLALQAYNREPDAFVITRSIACFERSLISGFSRYDHYSNYEDEKALTEMEKNGMDLFYSDQTNCYSCHAGFNFSNYQFENNGIYAEYTDQGRFKITNQEEDKGKFKVPSLRNVEVTGPYMHDGSIETLEQVIEHYNIGGKNNPQKNTLIRPLHLSEKEQMELIAFLKTLTDQHFIENPVFGK